MKQSTTIVFATHNEHKLREVKAMLGDSYNFLSLKDINCLEDIPETSPTIAGNALQKARYVFENYKTDCFAEDTGLEIDFLNGEPGVFTARYAGDDKNPQANMDKVLQNMGHTTLRSARFRTVIAYIRGNEEFLFEGVAEGSIALTKMGAAGFGYDPIFQPAGFEQTFAELDDTTKNAISHRAKAVQQFIAFLRN